MGLIKRGIVMRLTEKNKFSFIKNVQYFPSDSLSKKSEEEIAIILLNEVGKNEDIVDMLRKITFYGKVFQYPGQIMPLQFNEVFNGGENDKDIRIDFKLRNGLGNVFYSIFDYGKSWAFTKEELK